MKKFGEIRSQEIWPWMKFKILNFGIHWSNWTMAGALEWGLLGVPYCAKC